MGRHKKVAFDDLSSEQKYEMVASYREAKYPEEQVKVLSELYDVTLRTVYLVLQEAGLEVAMPQAKGKRFTLEEPVAPSLSQGPFYRAEALLVIVSPNDSDAVKDAAIQLVRELVSQDAFRALYDEV